MLELYDNFNAGGTPFGMGMGLAAQYRHEGATYADSKGYMFNFVDEGTTARLVHGGRYSGVVQVPDAVKFNGEEYPVVGIGENAFTNNYDVTEVRLPYKDQYITPGAYWGSGIPYDWESLEKPSYVYPDKDLFEFVTPNDQDDRI